MATRTLASGFLLGLATCSALGCGSSALLQCRVEAVKALPDDPTHLSFADVVDLTERLRQCKKAGDAGPQ